MLAEIFMVRLEAAARMAESAPTSDGRYVPFTRNTHFVFKDSRTRDDSATAVRSAEASTTRD